MQNSKLAWGHVLVVDAVVAPVDLLLGACHFFFIIIVIVIIVVMTGKKNRWSPNRCHYIR